ncbi:hypothetical protein GCM10027062_37830 [Nocardioides hungaricus]
MRRLPALVIALVVVVVVASVTAVGAIAWAIQDDDDWSARMGPGMMTSGSGSTPGWWDDSWGSMMGMMGRAGVASKPEYLAEMVAHHQEAVDAAGELARSDRPEMRAFGEAIVQTQSAQIQQMQAWLRDWYPEQSAAVDYRPMMRDLSGLSGDQLDQTFLQDMVGHHMMAVMTSQQLLWQGTDHDQVAQLARSIRDDQHAEIVQMQRWLAQWFDTDWRGAMGCGGWSGQASGWGMGPGMMWGSGR